MGQNIQDYSGGDPGVSQYQTQQGAPATPVSTTETKEVSPEAKYALSTDDIKKSNSLPIVLELDPSTPTLSITFQNANSTAKAKNSVSAEAFSTQSQILQNLLQNVAHDQSQINQAILDSWEESVRIQAEISKQASIESDQIESRLQSDRITQDAVKNANEKFQQEQEAIAKQGDTSVRQVAVFPHRDFMHYWAQASYDEKLSLSARYNDLVTEKYGVPANSITVQLGDAQKVLGPYAAAVVTTAMISEFVAANYANQLAIQGVSQIAPSSIDVNLLLPAYSLTAETSIGLKKSQESDPTKSQKPLDEEFAKEFAKKAKGKVDQLMDLLGDPQKALIAAQTALTYIATSLQLDIKSISEYSNLSKEELQDLMAKGSTGDEVLDYLLQRGNEIVSLLTTSAEGNDLLSQFYNMVDQFKDIKFESLKSIYESLFSSDAVIGTDQRIASEQG